MRQAGTLITKQDAERFANYLLSLGISSKVEPAADAWAIWVHDENQIPRSKQELEQFRREPADQRYADAEQTARQVRREEAERIRQTQKNYVDMRNEWASPWRRRPVTVALIAASVLVYLGVFEAPLDELTFSMPEIQQGEVWRLVTPIFLHFSLPHILFNMWWLYDLGSLIERRLNPVLFALLVLAIAVPSNFAQFEMSLPNSVFGGMSGVVYGLFGYAWVRSRLDPTCGLYLRPDVAFWMIGWFVLCASGAIGNVANWAHGAGLAAGALLGCLPHLQKLLGR
jgi:GlpG protein